jgi:acyl dehydratase
MSGLYFEEFEIGQVFDHALTRTVTEMDNRCTWTRNSAKRPSSAREL